MKMFEYAKLFMGTVYKIGGDNPMSGFDCSGLVCEVLRAFGLLAYNERLSAQQIWDRFHKGSTMAISRYADVEPDDLVFFGKLGAIGHVAIASGINQMIEAGGGDFSTDNLVTATAKDAFVRIRPIAMRRDFYMALRLK